MFWNKIPLGLKLLKGFLFYLKVNSTFSIFSKRNFLEISLAGNFLNWKTVFNSLMKHICIYTLKKIHLYIFCDPKELN